MGDKATARRGIPSSNDKQMIITAAGNSERVFGRRPSSSQAADSSSYNQSMVRFQLVKIWSTSLRSRIRAKVVRRGAQPVRRSASREGGRAAGVRIGEPPAAGGTTRDPRIWSYPGARPAHAELPMSPPPDPRLPTAARALPQAEARNRARPSRMRRVGARDRRRAVPSLPLASEIGRAHV